LIFKFSLGIFFPQRKVIKSFQSHFLQQYQKHCFTPKNITFRLEKLYNIISQKHGCVTYNFGKTHSAL